MRELKKEAANLRNILICIISDVVHLDVEDFSEELLQCLLCHKEHSSHPKPPTRGFGTLFACSSLVLYGIRIVGFHARKGPIIGALMP